MSIRRTLPVIAALSVVSLAWAQTTQPAARTFSDVAAESFASWDENKDGTLSADEVDKLVVEPKFKGEYAAALAAMKLVVRSSKVKPPELTLDFVTNHSKEPAGELLPSEQPNTPEPAAPAAKKRDDNGPDAKKPTPTTTRPPASLERRYQSALRKIRSYKPDLFADGTPDIETCRQGPLGSCFFVAGVGALVHRDPEAVKQMIRTELSETGKASYIVTFGDGKSVTVPALTESQYGLTSSSGRDGHWLAVLEQAYGSVRMKARPEDRRTMEASDALAKGGSLATTLKALTGHVIDRTRLRANADKDPELAGKVKTKLAGAVKTKRLAGASTGTTAPLPPGVNGKHAYAILGFDEETGVVKLWNPHGNTFRPKGEPGLDKGYDTRGGVFEMPLEHFIRVFDSLVVETEKSPESTEGPGRS